MSWFNHVTVISAVLLLQITFEVVISNQLLDYFNGVILTILSIEKDTKVDI